MHYACFRQLLYTTTVQQTKLLGTALRYEQLPHTRVYIAYQYGTEQSWQFSTSQTLHFIGIYMGRMAVIVCIQCLTTSCYHLIEPLKTFLTGMALVKTTLSCLAILSAENSSLPTQTKQLTLRAGLDDEINLVHKVSQWLTFAKYGNHVWTIFDLSKKLIVSHPKTKVAIGCSTCYTLLHHY